MNKSYKNKTLFLAGKLALWKLEYDNPAGTCEVVPAETEVDFYGETFESREEAQAQMDKEAGPTRYAIFENRPSGEMFYSPMDKFSGSWNKFQPDYSYSGIGFDTEEEAEKFVNSHSR